MFMSYLKQKVTEYVIIVYQTAVDFGAKAEI